MRIAPIVSTAALALVLSGCATRQAGRDEIVVTAAKGGQADEAADSSVPPPAPPPPAVLAQMPSPSVVASPAYRRAGQIGATRAKARRWHRGERLTARGSPRFTARAEATGAELKWLD